LSPSNARSSGRLATLDETLRAIRTDGIDGALLDVQLGEASIHPAIEELVRRGIPFIMVTGQGNLGRPPALLGNAPILTKPFRVEQLENMMSSTFRLRDRGKPHQP
jgi:DNA-binding NtrC family response regulator